MIQCDVDVTNFVVYDELRKRELNRKVFFVYSES
jgi:hypothetical protein